MKKRLTIFSISVLFSLILLVGFANVSVKASHTPSYNAEGITIIGNSITKLIIEGKMLQTIESIPDIPEKKILLDMVIPIDKKLKEIGEYKSDAETTPTLTESGNTVKYEKLLHFEKGDFLCSVIFDISSLHKSNLPMSISLTDAHTSLGKKMENAAINTIFGISFIFLVLIFISFVIRALSIVPKIFDKKVSEIKPVEENTISVENIEQENEPSSEELIAVMTAAIMMYEADNSEAPSDGLFVRSIRRKNARNI